MATIHNVLTPATTVASSPIIMTKPKQMNHKAWKAYLKKMKRKEMRRAAAIERDQLKGENVSSTDSEDERERQREEAEKQRQNQLWLERERQAQLAFQAKIEWEEKERKRKEEVERKIKEEWEERERKEKEEGENKNKQEQERRLKQDKLLKEATANENTNAWHNPFAPVQFSKEQERQVEHCPFFKKTAACRFGDHCSRYHEYPEVSTTILLPNMFSSFQLEQSIVDNVDTDISLEYDDNELFQSFKEFYEDVVIEFKKAGTVVQFKVCCNCEPHLRGNVYVQYKRETAAQKAYEMFNARWYGGRQLTCVFVNIESWKSAICGLAFKKRCPKGKSCNFLHVFRNPGGEYMDMDLDRQLTDRYSRHGERASNNLDRRDSHRDRYRRDSVRSHRSRQKSNSKSPDRGSRVKRRSRSRSQSRSSCVHRRSRSPSAVSKSRSSGRNRRSVSQSPDRTHRSHSRSPDRGHRLRSRSPDRTRRSRSRSPNRHHISRSSSRFSRSYYKSKSRSPTRSSRSHYRSKSRSPNKLSRSHHRLRSTSPSRRHKSRKSESRSPKRNSDLQRRRSRSNSIPSSDSSPSHHTSSSANTDSHFNKNGRDESLKQRHNESSLKRPRTRSISPDVANRRNSRSPLHGRSRSKSNSSSSSSSSKSHVNYKKKVKHVKDHSLKKHTKKKKSDSDLPQNEEYEYVELTKETIAS